MMITTINFQHPAQNNLWLYYRKKQNLENLCNGGEIFTLVSREWSLTVAFQLTAELETF